MKKTLFVFTVSLLCSTAIWAQQVAIEKSVEFDEPEYGWNKLMQLKNGNTFFFHSTKKDGIEVTVYNKQRKKISSRTLESNLWDVGKMRESKIVGLHEINGEPVLFIVQAEDREPTLYRMRINPNTGGKMGETKLGHLPKITMGTGYAMLFGHVDPMDIVVEKDPLSDCYAVIYFNSFAHDRSERIKVVHYDGMHKVLGQAFYDSPNGEFKYLVYIGALVDGNKRVFVTTYGHNGNSSDVSSRIIVSRLNVGDTNFTHKLLDFSEDFLDTKSIMLYNHNNNKIQLLTLSYTKTKSHFFTFGNKPNSTSYYLTLISYIDPETLTLAGVKPLKGELVNAYGVKNIDKDYEYEGMPQQMIINKDNSTTVLSEEILHVTNTTSRGTVMSKKTFLGPIGISELSDTGAELKGYAISKKQEADGDFPKLYISQRSKGRFMYAQQGMVKSNVNEFLSYDYINTDKERYVIFNDLPANSDKDEDEEKRKTVARISATNTMCYKLNDQKMDKFYLFGEPDDTHNSTFCYIESSDYNKDLNTYATMIVERNGRDKQARIAWVNFK